MVNASSVLVKAAAEATAAQPSFPYRCRRRVKASSALVKAAQPSFFCARADEGEIGERQGGRAAELSGLASSGGDGVCRSDSGHQWRWSLGGVAGQFARKEDRMDGSIVIVVQLEVLQIECELIGRPKACELCCTGKHYELQIQHGEPYHGSAPNYTQPDNAYYSGAQGWKGLLTEGTVVAMLEGKMTDAQQPVMQVVNVSLASIKDNNFSLYHVLLSDGVYQEHAVLSDETHSLVEQNRLRGGSIVRILVFRCKSSMNYRAFGVCLEVLQTECELIGSPRFHEFGLKRKEPSVNSDANVPMLPEQNYPAADSVVDRCVKEVSMNLPEVNWLNCIPRWLQEAAAKESNWHP